MSKDTEYMTRILREKQNTKGGFIQLQKNFKIYELKIVESNGNIIPLGFNINQKMMELKYDIEVLKDDIIYYNEILKRAKQNRELRKIDGCQENIDRCYDKLNKLKKGLKNV